MDQALIEVQKTLIGSLVAYPDLISRVYEILGIKRVFRSDLQVIYDTTISLSEKREHIDLLTVVSALPNPKLSSLVYECGTLATTMGVDTYAKLLVEAYIKRQLGDFSKEIEFKANKSDQDAFELLEYAEQKVFRLSTSTMRKNFAPSAEVVKSTLERIEKARKAGFAGVSTGFDTFDEILGGMQNQDLLILAGRPSMGKTALALAIASNNAEGGFGVGIFSAEMGSNQLMSRILAKKSGISGHRIILGLLSETEHTRVKEAGDFISQLPFFIEDSGGLTIGELKAKARRLKHEEDVSLIIVDYLQLVLPGHRKEMNREQEVSYVSRNLKFLAKELDVPVLCLSQLNRQIEGRSGKRPQLNDLRESGAIEQDADVVMFIHADSNGDDWRDVIIEKHRNGPLGETRLLFNKSTNEFLEEKTKEIDEVGKPLPKPIRSFYDTDGDGS